MKNDKTILTKFVFSASIIAAISVLFISAMTHIYKEQIFLDRAHITTIELFVLMGFFFIIFFIGSSIYWFVIEWRKDENSVAGNSIFLFMGLFCLVVLIGEKILADEIGREMRLGWEITGELIILNILLAIQLAYSLLVLAKLFRFMKS